AIHLWRFTSVVRRTTSIFHNGIDEETDNCQKDGGGHHQDEHRETVNGVCRCRNRSKHVGSGSCPARISHCCSRQADPEQANFAESDQARLEIQNQRARLLSCLRLKTLACDHACVASLSAIDDFKAASGPCSPRSIFS